MRRRLLPGWFFAAILLLATACSDGNTSADEAECGNGIVEGDEACDSGTFGSARCTPACDLILPSDEVCDDELDNDFDDATDCEDDDCADQEHCALPDEDCNDGEDNDGDGDTDCDDSDCDEAPNCVIGDEICDDELDNDRDTDTDCDDDDCLGFSGCPELCNDSLDNDGDGVVDCFDDDCAGHRDCPPRCGDGREDRGEQCDEGRDNDDTLTDACRTDCRLPSCGDGVIDTGEACDEGRDTGAPGICWGGCIFGLDGGCSDPRVLSAADNGTPAGAGARVRVDLAGGGDDWTPPEGCHPNPSTSGDDAVVIFVPPETSWFMATTAADAASPDTVIGVGRSCTLLDELGCNDNTLTSPGSEVLFQGFGGEPVFIVVDAVGSVPEAYLEITPLVGVAGEGDDCTPRARALWCETDLVCLPLSSPVCGLPNGTCAAPIDLFEHIGFGDFAHFDVTFDGRLYPAEAAGSCGGSGGEVVGMYTPEESGWLTVEVTDGPPTSAAYLRRTCGDPESEELCIALGEAATLEVEEGEELFIFYDSDSDPGETVTVQYDLRALRFEGDRCDTEGVESTCEQPLFCNEAGRCARHEGVHCDHPLDARYFGEGNPVTGEMTVTIDLREHDDNFSDATCGGTGGSLVIEYVPDLSGSLVVSASGFDPPFLSGRVACDYVETEIGCGFHDDFDSVLEVPIEAGVPVYIVAEAVTPESAEVAEISFHEVRLRTEGESCDIDGFGERCEESTVCVPVDSGGLCTTQEAGTCAEPTSMELLIGGRDPRLGPADFLLTDPGLTLDHTASCGVSSSMVVRYLPPGPGVYFFETDPGPDSATLFARAECTGPDSEYGCATDTDGGGNLIEIVATGRDFIYLHFGGFADVRGRISFIPIRRVGQPCDILEEDDRCASGTTCLTGVCERALEASCFAPIDLTVGDGDIYGSGVTIDIDLVHGNRYAATCGGEGYDAVGTFVAPTDGNLIVDYNGTDVPPTLALRGVCDAPASESHCDGAGHRAEPVSWVAPVAAGEQVFVMFDTSTARTEETGTAVVRFTATSIPACEDGFRSVGESDVDCGGPHCPECLAGRRCTIGRDCAVRACVDGRCATSPTCDDGLVSGSESDVDCGGSCARCLTGATCRLDQDCATNECVDDVCVISPCDDSVVGGFESDTDCGGPICTACPTGEQCLYATDCASRLCVDWACAAPSCDDRTLNQDEILPDCGGVCGGDPCLTECPRSVPWVDLNAREVADGVWRTWEPGVGPPVLPEGPASFFEPSCGDEPEPVPEMVHRFEVPVSARYRFRTSLPGIITDADTILYASDGACNDDEPYLSCNADRSEIDSSSELILDLAEGSVLFIVVDGTTGADAGATYVLDVRRQ